MSSCGATVGKLLGGDVPDPGGAVADDDALGGGVETAPYCLAIDALCEGGRLRVGVAAGRALDRGVVADRPEVTHGPALLVTPFGRPQSGQLDLARLGRAVGLLPAAALDLGGAHRHAAAVHPQVHRRRGAGDGFCHSAFVGGDLTSQSFGTALDLLGLDAHRGQFPQQVAGRGEAEVRGRPPHHPQHAGRQRRGVHTQGPVARTHTHTAGVAMVVGPFQGQQPEQRGEGLGATAGVARLSAAATRDGRIRRVGIVRVEELRQRLRGKVEGSTTQGLLDGLEVPRATPPWSEQRSNFSRKRGYERGVESVFAASLAVASARR